VVECRAWEACRGGRRCDLRRQTPAFGEAARKRLGWLQRPISESRPQKAARPNRISLALARGRMAAIDAAQTGWLVRCFMVRARMNADRDAEHRARGHYKIGRWLLNSAAHVTDRVVRSAWGPRVANSWLRTRYEYSRQTADPTISPCSSTTVRWRYLHSQRRCPESVDSQVIRNSGHGWPAVVNPTDPPRLRVNMRKPRGPYRAGCGPPPPPHLFVGDFKELARRDPSGSTVKALPTITTVIAGNAVRARRTT